MSEKISVQDREALSAGIKERSHLLPWYTEFSKDDISPKMWKILETYSGIAPADIVPHVLAIRDKAFDIFPYPCIGGFRFLHPSLGASPRYGEVLERVKAGGKLLDLGCCFGQDMRLLAADGAPAENLYGVDLEPQFLDLGFELFRDREKLHNKATFMAADIFDPESPLQRLNGQFDVVQTGSFLHLFGWDQSVQAAVTIATLLKREKGVLVVGRQIGGAQPGAEESSMVKSYRHNADSFRKMWDEVGEKTGDRWVVTVETEIWDSVGVSWTNDQMLKLKFVVERQ